MPKLPGIRHQDAVRVFEKLGYRIIRQSGHIVMSNGENRLVIPRANPVDPFTMGAIARDAGLTPDEFRKQLLTAPAATKKTWRKWRWNSGDWPGPGDCWADCGDASGEIRIRSRVGRDTTLRIALPVK